MIVCIQPNPSLQVPKELIKWWKTVRESARNTNTKVNVRSYATLPQTLVTKELRHLLRVQPKSGGKPQPRPYSVLDTLSPLTYGFPRSLGIELFGVGASRCVAGAPIQLNRSSIQLRDYQKQVCDTVSRELQKEGPRGGLLLACCGAGKTVMAIEIIRRMGVRAAVVVHKDFLMRQWKDRINTFLPEAKVGYVQRNRAEIEGFDIVLCMMQTLVQRNYDKDFMESIGLVIYDETHHICAKTFSRSLRHFPARCRLGLTATPERGDGLGYLITWMLGPVLCTVQRKTETSSRKESRVEVYSVRCNVSIGPMIFNRMGDPCFTSMVTKLVKSLERNTLITKLIQRLVSEKRNILVASARRTHLVHLKSLLLNSKGFEDTATGLYVGESSKRGKAKRDKGAPHWQVIFTTFQMGEEGLDLPHLDTLVLTSPKKSVEQLVGRVTRRAAASGARVYDLDDCQVSMFSGMHRRRMSQYAKLSFHLK